MVLLGNHGQTWVYHSKPHMFPIAVMISLRSHAPVSTFYELLSCLMLVLVTMSKCIAFFLFSHVTIICWAYLYNDEFTMSSFVSTGFLTAFYCSSLLYKNCNFLKVDHRARSFLIAFQFYQLLPLLTGYHLAAWVTSVLATYQLFDSFTCAHSFINT